MISFAKKHHELIVNIIVLLMIISFLFGYFKPSLLFLDTTTTGGDMPGHNVLAHYLKTDLLPNGKLIGWFPYSLSGFPLFQYYFFLPYFIAALLSYLMPFNIAFKLSTVVGIFLLPIAVFISTKLIGFRFPAPAIASIFSLLFLFKEEGFAAGGTIKSALAGQFSFTLSLVFLFIALGGIYRGIERQNDRIYFIINILAISLIVFSHIFSMIPLLLICSFFIIEALIKKKLGNVLYLAKVFGLAFLLTGFWSVPYLLKRNWTMLLLGYNQIGLINLDFLVSKFFLPFLIAALLAVILSKFKRAYLYTFYWFLIVNIFLFAFNASLLHARFFNVLYLFILISASSFFSVFSKRLKAKWLLPLMAFFIIAGLIHSTNTTAAGWIKWNYEGVENKNTYSTYQKINDFFLNKDFPGRIDFEYYNYDNLGSPRIFELSPLFHKKPVMEGLLFESSLTYPFFFYMQKEVSETSWWPGFDIRIPTQNMTKGMKEFWLFNVKYFVARSNKTKALLKGNPGYALEKAIGEFGIYRINQKSQYVEVLKKEPILFVTDDWKKYALDWMGSDERETFFVFTKNLKPKDTDFFDIIVSEKPVMGENKKIFGANQIESALSQSENIKRECKIEETVENQRISFKTNCVGLPHLIKMSYYPNWKVKGAKKVYLISPAMMMVIPERTDVELYYGATFSDIIGIAASLIASIVILLLAFKPGLIINEKTERIESLLKDKLRTLGNYIYKNRKKVLLVFVFGAVAIIFLFWIMNNSYKAEACMIYCKSNESYTFKKLWSERDAILLGYKDAKSRESHNFYCYNALCDKSRQSFVYVNSGNIQFDLNVDTKNQNKISILMNDDYNCRSNRIFINNEFLADIVGFGARPKGAEYTKTIPKTVTKETPIHVRIESINDSCAGFDIKKAATYSNICNC